MRKRLLVVTAGAVGVLTAVPALATPGPGAPGAGDAYYPDAGNGGYDVGHYDLRLKYQPADDRLEGTATLLATATQDLSRFNLDFLLNVSSVTVNGRTAAYARSGTQELEVTPPRTVKKGDQVTVVVRYSGVPSTVKVDGASNWIRTPDGGVAANEPQAAAWWFPSNDHPTDKATYDVSVQVPDGYQAVSNGIPAAPVSRAGWTRYGWRSAQPQATYLALLAVGKFDLTTDTTESGLPIVNAYSRDLGANAGAARASLERTGEIVDWQSTLFGPYPFDATGGVVPNTTTRYALETQGRPFYSPAQFARGSNTYVVVHEIAHQWYGDSVSVKRWRDIWLNEGFARYAEWLWSEKEGEGTTQELADWFYESTPADDPFWQVKPGDPGAANQFHAAVYNRGALTLQALRNKIGDESFFKILKGWPAAGKFGNASIEQFIAYAERVSGRQLRPLFDTWLFTQGRPPAGALNGQAKLKLQGKAKEPRSWKKIQQAGTALH